MVLDSLLTPRRMAELDRRTARLIGVVRLWAALRSAGRCPIEPAAERLGSPIAARQLQMVLETIGAAWPDPLAVAPPCCPILSHDEATLAAMIDAASCGNRPRFDWQVAEMLGEDARARLYAGLIGLSAHLALSSAD